jgi:hypothetical protein
MLLDKPANPINNFGSRQFEIIGSGVILLHFLARRSLASEAPSRESVQVSHAKPRKPQNHDDCC